VSVRFVSEPLRAAGEEFVASPALSQGEPPLPRRFHWRDEEIEIAEVVATRRSTKDDRGDTYLARHWYDVRLADGREATIYFDRKAKRGTPPWWLYSVTGES
jgi:Family of unknown function (DUF6504)